jgi:hypothetical protein
MRRAQGATEFLDRPVSPADRDGTLADIVRLSAWFGGYWLSSRAVERLAGASRALLIADVGGGRGDFARRVRRRAARRGRRIRVVVVDRDGNLPARAAGPGLLAVRADATALPFRAGAVDVVTASLTLHHLEPAAAVRCLAEMRAAARLGVVVNDLLRSPVTLALVWLATRLLARHRFSRHDGPLSVRRAYSPQELRRLAARAGIARLVVRRYPALGRLVAVAT